MQGGRRSFVDLVPARYRKVGDLSLPIETELQKKAWMVSASDPRVAKIINERFCLGGTWYHVTTCIGVETRMALEEHDDICNWCGRSRMPHGEENDRAIIAIGEELANEK